MSDTFCFVACASDLTLLFAAVAFPMVLAGTALTAVVAFYLFPYDWSFNLAMTFGAILSATVSCKSHRFFCETLFSDFSQMICFQK